MILPSISEIPRMRVSEVYQPPSHLGLTCAIRARIMPTRIPTEVPQGISVSHPWAPLQQLPHFWRAKVIAVCSHVKVPFRAFLRGVHDSLIGPRSTEYMCWTTRLLPVNLIR